MKNILVPTDFSPQSEYALKAAAQLAKKYDAQIHLLHVLELPIHLASVDSGQIPEALFFLKLAHQRFEKFMDKPYLKGIKIHESVESQKMVDGIAHFVKSNDVDLIVMGSSGASGIKEMFIGSNTEKVVRNSDIPVLILKEEMKNAEINNFVYACDFETTSYNSYKKAVEFADDFDAEMHLLFVNTPNQFTTTNESEMRMSEFVGKLKPKNYSLNIYNDDTIEQGILNFSRSINADMIGVSTHGRRGLNHFFNGSIGEDVANHAIRPVITFKIEE
ncbi:universal stress protein [Abyssalbus ytuae]|uniref:Universal stress protein n=1 Tax=Abyssalbus ytuae TaxID=2926907 RepID=A0A9E7D151_9FLAO|nr:universal stress protein [Abyssalbus ytuae]UOB19015.1 universal stress protein [Abyssalbus ytuae]